jgi:hypothetical protein
VSRLPEKQFLDVENFYVQFLFRSIANVVYVLGYTCRFLRPMTHDRIYLDPDEVPPLAGVRLYAILGVFHHALFVPFVSKHL